MTIRDICGKHSQAACEGASHRLHRFTRILGAEEKDTNHTDVAQEKSVTIRDICGKTFSRKIRDNPWNLWENILSSSMRRSPHRLHRFTRILGTEKKDTNHTDVAQEKSVTIRGIRGKKFSRNRNICENPWNLWDNILKLRAEEPPTDYADLHGCGCGADSTNHTDMGAYRDNINTIKNKKNKFREEYEECSYNCERGNGQHHPAL